MPRRPYLSTHVDKYKRDPMVSDEMPRGVVMNRARDQFQALYKILGTFEAADILSEHLVLWPPVVRSDGSPFRPSWAWKTTWCEAVDDGNDSVAPQLLQHMQRKIEAYTETQIRMQVITNAKAARLIAEKVVKGEMLEDKDRQTLLTLNNGTGFVYGNVFNKRAAADAPKIKGKTKYRQAQKKAEGKVVPFDQSA